MVEINKFVKFCVHCSEPINPNMETSVHELRFGTIKHGIFNRAGNYSPVYVHENCFEPYLAKRVEWRKEYASNTD